MTNELRLHKELFFLRYNGTVSTSEYAVRFKLTTIEAIFQLKAMEFCGLVIKSNIKVRNGHGYGWRVI